MTNLSPEVEADLHKQLIKLGDMMGDGMHLEPGGSWIKKDYARVARALGNAMPSTRRKRPKALTDQINKRMSERTSESECPECKRFSLKQTRSGSMKARCTICGRGYTLLKIQKGEAPQGA
ncbi:hypothetical protein [Enterobacter bugandensis]|uniref:hypothetical protein n=1 Tax=Enterobacter bugandensis TaxID=881260 RepID=UPI0021CE63A5|nr:hypothetical protein [Enterobacter bugandensis]MCU6214465.1 hypothetical protein [Enterobacter bugandensis]